MKELTAKQMKKIQNKAAVNLAKANKGKAGRAVDQFSVAAKAIERENEERRKLERMPDSPRKQRLLAQAEFLKHTKENRLDGMNLKTHYG
jgi:hypothetical protein